MSDAAIASIVTGAVTVTTIIVGWMTMRTKLRYSAERANDAALGVEAVSEKLDNNTALTGEAKEAATEASKHTKGCDLERMQMLKSLNDHDTRIANLEGRMTELRVSVDSLGKDIVSTRHEVRNHFQTLTNKLDIMMATTAKVSDKA